MRWYTKVLAAGLAALLQACVTPPVVAPAPIAGPAEARAPVTILLSIDGFRPDYLDRGLTPALSALGSEGVRAAMRPSFPSKTFPNHYAIVTGLRPDRNGIVANRFEDPARPNEVFTMASLQPYWWDQAEPIWVAAEKAGIATGTMFWPGSNAKVRGTYPSVWQQFNQEIPGDARVDTIVDWMRRPAAKRPRFVTLYFDTVDSAGHEFGPDAPETNAAVAKVDALVARLQGELGAMGQPVNWVIVADHGMALAAEDRIIRLDQLLPPDAFRTIEDGPYAQIHAQPGREAEVAAALRRPHSHMQCWPRAEIPARFHYGSNPRIAPWFCLAETGWLILAKAPPPDRKPHWGNHGWDNADPLMRALFIASGPAFARGVQLEPFDNVDVYALLRHVIGLPPAQGVDGSEDAIRRAYAR